MDRMDWKLVMADGTNRRAGSVSEVFKLLPQLQRGLEARMPEHSRAHDASPAQMKVILHLAEYGPQTMGDLAEGLAITTPSATGLVGPLVDKGYVQRERDSMDRRVVRVSLTREAERFGRAALEERRAEVAKALDGMSVEAQEHFAEGLRRLVGVYADAEERVSKAS